jgi:peptidylprolyl isomerase
MRTVVTCLLAAFTLACAPAAPPDGTPEPSSRYSFWRPAPVEGAREPSEVLAASADADWRRVAADNLLLVELAGGGLVAIELASEFAPVHVANIRSFARAGWWDGATLYRVQENYVVQWGVNESDRPLPRGVVEAPPAEYHRPLAGLSARPLGYPDSYAPMVGHADGWPIAWDPESGRAWLTHCYGAVGAGRGLSPDTGTGGELYAVIGHAPRHLDLNIATVGRVLDGLHHMASRPRGSGNLGFYDAARGEVPLGIVRARLAADIPAAERPAYEVLRTDTDTFSAFVTGRANRGGTFFDRPAGGIDLCNVNVPVRPVRR